MRKQIAVKLMLPVAALVLVAAALVGWVIAGSMESSIVEGTTKDVNLRLSSLDETMLVVRDMGVEKVKISLGLMKSTASAWGQPSRFGSAKVGQETVPNLYVGGRPQANDFRLVDQVTGVSGGTATLFVRRGNEFIRISTNVKKSDGSRAIGTLLDPKGKAIASILKDEPFYGVVDILGSPYITGYEPITGKDGTIGIWYAGYPVNSLDMLRNSIESYRPLEVGFAALLDGKGNVVFHGKGVTPEEVSSIAAQAEDESEWIVHRRPVPSWGYSLLSAYPRSAVTSRVRNAQMAVAFGAVFVVALLMMLTIWFLVRRIISAPLADVARRMEQADLSARFNSNREDEIGRLLKAFDRFVTSVREILQEVSQASTSVVSASTEISASAEQMAAGAQQQTAQTAEVATAVEEMTKTLVENGSNASAVAEVAKQEKAAAENGGMVVQETINGMKRIAEAVHRASGIVGTLGKSSEQIGEIVQVINDIADQTNLLALNAAIEAARAGEQGRGFAVVADEVRKLAERTTKATKEIGAMIKAIQQSTAEAVSAMDQGSGQVQHGLTLADRAGDSLTEIVHQSQDLLDKITQIAGAIEEQSATAEEIAKNTDAIRKVSEETAVGTRQMAKAADDLNRLTDTLQEMLARVKLTAREDSGTGPMRPQETSKPGQASNVAVGAHGELVLNQ